MTAYQRQKIAQQRARSNRRVEQARVSKTRKDEVNAGWALNLLNRMGYEAND